MAVHSRIKALMYKIFPSSLGPVAIRWFNGLGAGSINSFEELTRAFGSRFITSSRVPWSLDSLLSITIREGETLKTYSDRYWEMFNEIDKDFDDVAIRTFKVEEDQQQGKGKAEVIPQEMRDFRSDRYNNNRPRRDFAGNLDLQLLKWSARCSENRQEDHTGLGTQGNTSSRPPLGTINVIFAALGGTGSRPSRVMSVARTLAKDSNSGPKRAKMDIRLALSFSKEDKIGTTQPHNDLVVMLRIEGYNVKRVMVVQDSGAEIMYHDLYKWLNLKPEDLTADDSPLISFDVQRVRLDYLCK
ncbi:uncharacterized protein LOC142613512 [Castanea sativa]|uniref:uncharacterized protein LOC142613512 n=1 Tax=Castanea sativa TaxID=21020 RepID=UPI003F6495B5